LASLARWIEATKEAVCQLLMGFKHLFPVIEILDFGPGEKGSISSNIGSVVCSPINWHVVPMYWGYAAGQS